jgi:plasmid replication initiation protein
MDKKQELVVHSSTLLKTVGKLSTMELKLMFHCITKVRRDGDMDDGNRHFELSHTDFSERIGKDNCYVSMREAARKLMRRTITFGSVIDKNGRVWDGEEINVLARQKWNEGEGVIRLSFTSEFMPLLVKLKGNYAQYLFNDVSKLESHYAIIFYGILRNHFNIQEKYHTNDNLIITVDEMRRIFELESKYKAHKDFKKYVLDRAVDEINKLSPLNVKYEQDKRGRRIDGYIFKVTEKAKNLDAGAKASKKVQKTCEGVKKAFENGKIIKINGDLVKDISGNIVSFNDGAGNLFELVKKGAEIEIYQREKLF